MKTTPTNFDFPKANRIGDPRAGTPTYDVSNYSPIVPDLYLTLASCPYDGPDQYLTASASDAIPTLIYLASGGQPLDESASQTAVRLAANPINFTLNPPPPPPPPPHRRRANIREKQISYH